METSRTFFDYVAVGMTIIVIVAMLALLARTLTLVMGFLSLSYASWLEWFRRRKSPSTPDSSEDETIV